MLDQFKKAQKPIDSAPALTFDQYNPGVAEGKKAFLGMTVLSVLVDVSEVNGRNMNTGEPEVSRIYKLHTFTNPNDQEALNGKQPDGVIVNFWSKPHLNKNFDYGSDGKPVQKGDIVMLRCHGKKQSKRGNGQMFWDIEIFFKSGIRSFEQAQSPNTGNVAQTAPVPTPTAPLYGTPAAPNASANNGY